MFFVLGEAKTVKNEVSSGTYILIREPYKTYKYIDD